MRRLLPLAASCALIACTAASSESVGRSDEAIINGQLDTTHSGVVAIFSKMAGCTGTILHVNGGYAFVLTAAHCFNNGPIDVVVRGNDYMSPDQILQVVDTRVHPFYSKMDNSFDFALLKAVGAADSLQQILPLAPGEDKLKANDPVEHVGYGLVSYPNGKTTARHHAFGKIAQVGLVQFSYDQPQSGPCSGDSGGPELVETAGGTRVAGVISFGDQECKVAGVSGRVSSVYKDFIVPFVGALPNSGNSTSTTVAASTSGAGGSSADGGATGTGQGGATNDWTAGDLNYQPHSGSLVSSKCSAAPGLPSGSWAPAALFALAVWSRRRPR